MNKSIKVKMHSLVLVMSIIGVLCACGEQTSATSTPIEESSITSSSDKQLGPPDRVDVVYFTRGKPCHCIAVVGDTIQVIAFLYFQDEQSNGKLTFQMVDLDKQENIDIVKKYNAAPFSLFLNEVRGDQEKIIAVTELWSTPRDAIEELVKHKIEQSLNGEL